MSLTIFTAPEKPLENPIGGQVTPEGLEGGKSPQNGSQGPSSRNRWILRGFTTVLEVLPYVPGFGGHRRRWQCKCVVTDEAVCGRVPVLRESERVRETRLRGAVVLAAREARVSAWLAELAGHTRRGVSGSLAMRTAPRIDRKLTEEESRAALVWARAQRLNKVSDLHRKDIAAQFWIELRQPPADSRPRNWVEEMSQAWERARWVFRRENQPLEYVARQR